jgi:uncharacterized protein YqgC (DUF456 family)
MYAARMDVSVVYYAVAAVLILVGLAGTILPALPGVPLVFIGMLLAAWAGHFQDISVWTVVLLGVLAAIAMALDVLSGLLGAKRVGASKAALWGAMIGTVVGLFFGLLGLLFGPFVGALAGEMLSGSSVTRSAHVGLATWIGLLFGTLAKLALSFTMLGIFVLALIVP